MPPATDASGMVTAHQEVPSLQHKTHLVSRLTHGRIMLGHMSAWLRNRHQLEAAYAQKQTRMADDLFMQTDGTFHSGWSTFCVGAKQAAVATKRRAAALSQLSQEFDLQANEQDRRRKMAVKAVTKAADDYREAEKKLKRSMESDALTKAREAVVKSEAELVQTKARAVKLKDIEKAQKTVSKATKRVQELENAQRKFWTNRESTALQYRATVQANDQLLCQLEHKRLITQRNFCWLVCNLDTNTANRINQLQDNCRECLLNFDLDMDMNMISAQKSSSQITKARGKMSSRERFKRSFLRFGRQLSGKEQPAEAAGGTDGGDTATAAAAAATAPVTDNGDAAESLPEAERLLDEHIVKLRPHKKTSDSHSLQAENKRLSESTLSVTSPRSSQAGVRGYIKRSSMARSAELLTQSDNEGGAAINDPPVRPPKAKYKTKRGSAKLLRMKRLSASPSIDIDESADETPASPKAHTVESLQRVPSVNIHDILIASTFSFDDEDAEIERMMDLMTDDEDSPPQPPADRRTKAIQKAVSEPAVVNQVVAEAQVHSADDSQAQQANAKNVDHEQNEEHKNEKQQLKPAAAAAEHPKSSQEVASAIHVGHSVQETNVFFTITKELEWAEKTSVVVATSSSEGARIEVDLDDDEAPVVARERVSSCVSVDDSHNSSYSHKHKHHHRHLAEAEAEHVLRLQAELSDAPVQHKPAVTDEGESPKTNDEAHPPATDEQMANHVADKTTFEASAETSFSTTAGTDTTQNSTKSSSYAADTEENSSINRQERADAEGSQAKTSVKMMGGESHSAEHSGAAKEEISANTPGKVAENESTSPKASDRKVNKPVKSESTENSAKTLNKSADTTGPDFPPISRTEMMQAVRKSVERIHKLLDDTDEDVESEV